MVAEELEKIAKVLREGGQLSVCVAWEGNDFVNSIIFGNVSNSSQLVVTLLAGLLSNIQESKSKGVMQVAHRVSKAN